MRFHDRNEAGRRLAARLADLEGTPLVIALRGPALEVAQPVADAFGTLVHAVSEQKSTEAPPVRDGLHHRELLEKMGIRTEDIERVATARSNRSGRPPRPRREPLPDVTGRLVLVVDDGVGDPTAVAKLVQRLQATGPSRLIVAAPVADDEWKEAFDAEVRVLRERPHEGLDSEGYIVPADPDRELEIVHRSQERLRERERSLGTGV